VTFYRQTLPRPESNQRTRFRRSWAIDRLGIRSVICFCRMDIDRFAAGLPAIAAAVIRSDELETAVAGDVHTDDRFHIGSNTKAMTATLAAIAVERGLLGWTSAATAVLDVDGSNSVTLERLLAHAAGVRPLTDDAEFVQLPRQRSEVARLLVSEPPLFEPGTENAYSNGGYTVAAAMLEEATGETWEALLQTWLADPLSIELAVGWPDGLAGHYERSGELVRHDQTDGYDVPDAIAPAGDVSATIAAYGRFVQLHLRGLRDRPELIGRESFKRLHTPLRDAFALGWGVQQLEGARTSLHLGSAGTFFAVVALQADRDFAVAVLSNAGGDQAETASVALVRHLIGVRAV
jgi:D-alanyl-D-alanine carboxypeptidase